MGDISKNKDNFRTFQIITNQNDDNYKCVEVELEDRVAKCYRIKATSNFDDVKVGDLGGFIEDASCLDEASMSWIYDRGVILKGSTLYDNVKVRGKSIIGNNVNLYGTLELEDCNLSNVTIDGDATLNDIEIDIEAKITVEGFINKLKIDKYDKYRDREKQVSVFKREYI